jgi:hypothetical protein
MIQAQLARRQALATVLATMSIPREQSASIQSHGRNVLLIETHQPNNSRHLDIKMHGPHPIVVMPPIFRPQLTQLAPRIEVIVTELPVFDVNHFGRFAIQENERPPRRDDA